MFAACWHPTSGLMLALLAASESVFVRGGASPTVFATVRRSTDVRSSLFLASRLGTSRLLELRGGLSSSAAFDATLRSMLSDAEARGAPRPLTQMHCPHLGLRLCRSPATLLLVPAGPPPPRRQRGRGRAGRGDRW